MDKEIPIGSIHKNAKDEVRITLKSFKGIPLIDLRIWYRSEDGTFKPSPKGVALKIGQISLLIDLVQQAYKRALDEGMLDA